MNEEFAADPPKRRETLPHETILMRKKRMQALYDGRIVLLEHVNHDRFLTLAKRKELPSGSEWVAILEAIYARENITQEELSAFNARVAEELARKAVSRETQTNEQTA